MGQGKAGFKLLTPGSAAWANCIALPVDVARKALVCALADAYERPFGAPAGEAVFHPNGFVKLPVAVLPGTGQRLFLHVWLNDGEDSHVHNHRWDFTSTVLKGTVHNTLVDVGPDGDGPAYRMVRHIPHEGGFRFEGRDTADVRITGLRTVVLPEAADYAMDALALHRVRAERGTMTLVARGIPRRSWSDVVLDTLVQDGPRAMRPVDSSERERHLRAALEVLG